MAKCASHEAGVPAELVERLVAMLSPELVMVFGSRARGGVRPSSDVDLLLVGSWTLEPHRLLRHAHALVGHCFPRVDLVFCTSQDLEAAGESGDSFLQSIATTGSVIYRRIP